FLLCRSTPALRSFPTRRSSDLVLADRGESLALVALLVPSLLIGLGNGLGSGIVMTLGIDVSPVHGRTRYLAWWNTMLGAGRLAADRKSTRLNSSHVKISYAVFC